jgi:hypothetical protein
VSSLNRVVGLDGIVSFIRQLTAPEIKRYFIRNSAGQTLAALATHEEAYEEAYRIANVLKSKCSLYKALRPFVVTDIGGRYFGDDDNEESAKEQLMRLSYPGTVRPSKENEEVTLAHYGPPGWDGRSR